MHQPFLTTRKGVLFAEDCMALLKDLRSGCVDSVFADPPFNLGKDYKNGYHDKMSQFEYLRWCEEWITECCRILKPGGAIFIYATPELAVKFGNILNELATFRHWIALSMKGTYSRSDEHRAAVRPRVKLDHSPSSSGARVPSSYREVLDWATL